AKGARPAGIVGAPVDGAGVQVGELDLLTVGAQERRGVDGEDVMWALPVGSRAPKPVEPLAGQTEENAPVQRLIPAGEVHPGERAPQDGLVDRLVVAGPRRAERRVGDLDRFGTPPRPNRDARTAPDLKAVEQRGRGEKALLCDRGPRAALGHVKETRPAFRDVVSAERGGHGPSASWLPQHRHGYQSPSASP